MARTVAHAYRSALVCVLAVAGSPAVVPANAVDSVVVTDVAASAGSRSGPEPGDTLQAWSRDAPGAAQASLTSPFEFRRIEAEESALGTVILSGMRDGAPRQWRMPSAPWGIRVRPQPAPTDAHATDPIHAAWLHAETATRLSGEGRHEEANSAYDDAIASAALADPPLSATARAQLYDDWAAALVRQGDLADASVRLDDGLKVTAEGSLARAHLLARRGGVSLRLGDLDGAEEQFRGALAIRESLAPDGLLVAGSLYDLLLLARSRGDLSAADSAGNRALEIQQSDDPGSLATAKTRATLGQIALMRGDVEGARERFSAAYETLSVLAPGTRDLGSAITNLGILARQQGDAETAMNRFAEALAIFEKLNPEGGAVAMLNNNLGVVAHDYGDLARSERHLTRALELHERTAPDSLEIALYLDNLAGIARERGDMTRAEKLYRRALARREAKAQGSLEVAATLGNLADLLQERGDLERAGVYYARALEIERALAPGSRQEAATLSHLGSLADRQGDLALAESRHRQSLSMRERLAPDSLDVGSALAALASVISKKGNHAEAKRLAERALAIREAKAGTMLHAATSLYQLGRLAQSRGDAAEAVAYQRRAVELREQFTPDSHWVARAWNALGDALRMSGEVDASRDALCRATEILDRSTSRVSEIEEGRASFRALLSDYYRDCIGALVASGEPEAAFDGLERFRARWLLAMLAERDILFEADLPPEISARMRSNQTEYDRIVSEISELDPGEDAAAAETLWERTVSLREEREQIAKTVRDLSPRLAQLQYPEPLKLDAARASLPDATVLLSYSVGSENTVLFALRRDAAAGKAGAFRAYVIPTTRADLAGMVRSLRDGIQQKIPAEVLEQQSAKLYDLLIRPAEPLMAAGDALLISPDGPLNTLPFAALVREDAGSRRSFLVESRPLHFVVSTSVYAQLARPLRPRREGEPALVAFGDPDYGNAQPSGGETRRSFVGRARDLRPLPHARDEVRNIEQLFEDKTEVHLGAQATEGRVKSLGERADYVHFACHGFLDERFPLGSSLAMALPAPGAESSDNGFLQAWEIIEQVRLEADLVTLSACETGLGVEMGGEGLVGLVRAFHYAGARSVVASLWSVADQPTSELMRRFYASLRNGESKAGALRAAQISLIHGDRVEPKPGSGPRGVRRLTGKATTRHPFYWAAFQLFGAE